MYFFRRLFLSNKSRIHTHFFLPFSSVFSCYFRGHVYSSDIFNVCASYQHIQITFFSLQPHLGAKNTMPKLKKGFQIQAKFSISRLLMLRFVVWKKVTFNFKSNNRYFLLNAAFCHSRVWAKQKLVWLSFTMFKWQMQ